MPTKSAKSKSVKKKAPAAKALPAKKAKTKALPLKTAKPSSEPQKDSFMWKLLKKKEEERKQNQELKKSKFDLHASNDQLPTGIQGYTRFAGPRRKAA